ncbi:hypothetical protein AWV80_08110 [Cupriavidus sp. UYMU48A]|nr:hypothetical protein AWV80_20545 [Cupriavidus sp. UYMU48A]KAF7963592.1 hypothetical protein AWV80_08110 [Cupriavidus sp. UYMU48A]
MRDIPGRILVAVAHDLAAILGRRSGRLHAERGEVSVEISSLAKPRCIGANAFGKVRRSIDDAVANAGAARYRNDAACSDSMPSNAMAISTSVISTSIRLAPA